MFENNSSVNNINNPVNEYPFASLEKQIKSSEYIESGFNYSSETNTPFRNVPIMRAYNPNDNTNVNGENNNELGAVKTSPIGSEFVLISIAFMYLINKICKRHQNTIKNYLLSK